MEENINIKNFLSELKTRVDDDFAEYCVITELINVLKTEDKDSLIHELRRREREQYNQLLNNFICPDCGGKAVFQRSQKQSRENIDTNWTYGEYRCEDCGEVHYI